MFFHVLGQSSYQKSNRITTVAFSPTTEMRLITTTLLNVTSAADRQRLGESLLDMLCDAAAIDIVTLAIRDAKQKHRKRNGKLSMKQYGLYYPQKKHIVIENNTAIQGKIIAPKTFLDTLLHEWVHHYDTYKLHIRSLHTSGFYQRLSSLKKSLLP